MSWHPFPPGGSHPAGEDQSEGDEPSEINTRNHQHFAEVLKDKLTVVYTGKGNHTDFWCVQSDKPAPTERLVYYFEVDIIDSGTRGSIVVGLADKTFLLNRQPGWEANSYGYRAEDGKKFISSNRGEPYGPPFTKGDTIGCGINYQKDSIFFTHNGVDLGRAGTLGDSEYFPTIGLHSPGEKCKFNFKGPFVFDIDEYVMNVVREERELVSQMEAPVPDLTEAVRLYMLHAGLENSLKAFEKSLNIPPDSEKSLLPKRQQPSTENTLNGTTGTHGGPGDAAASSSSSSSSASSSSPPMANGTGAPPPPASVGVPPEGTEGGQKEATEGDPKEGAVVSSGWTAHPDQGGHWMDGGGKGAENGHGEQNGTRGGEESAPMTDGPQSPSKKPQEGGAEVKVEPAQMDGEKAKEKKRAPRGMEEIHLGPEEQKALAESLAIRKQIRSLVIDGDPEKAIELLGDHFPEVLSEQPTSLAVVLLVTQPVIERLRKNEVREAVEWLRTKVSKVRNCRPSAMPILMETAALLAYSSPENCALRSHFDTNRRGIAAELINQSIIMRSLRACPWSPLHCLLKHLVAAKLAFRARNHHRGPLPNARAFCLPLSHANASNAFRTTTARRPLPEENGCTENGTSSGGAPGEASEQTGGGEAQRAAASSSAAAAAAAAAAPRPRVSPGVSSSGSRSSRDPMGHGIPLPQPMPGPFPFFGEGGGPRGFGGPGPSYRTWRGGGTLGVPGPPGDPASRWGHGSRPGPSGILSTPPGRQRLQSAELPPPSGSSGPSHRPSPLRDSRMSAPAQRHTPPRGWGGIGAPMAGAGGGGIAAVSAFTGGFPGTVPDPALASWPLFWGSRRGEVLGRGGGGGRGSTEMGTDSAGSAAGPPRTGTGWGEGGR
uniref:B30.2/SPRY domain-containing protein n=1 Tax=Chromera velia CCMP2878 TaxID=1169474 RepID=A0A0G4G877_9ALVE|eukprot:Cvel_20657.t1-p1 / transcript=Cvel_20657.t1 / gene=Cvel_20657 / organism=Chromera_velia_CCMP2878 / gene_product=Ran-binding protein 10, putative / transcript_product=Ran-binding protein 10, putative / location=Cvel_scaffold1874:24896-30368(+) / protein_length=884 / sequence_SO=supercontig / SO=protein_coding / is_pseudo=false